LNLANSIFKIDWIDPKTGKLFSDKEINGGAQEFSPAQQLPVVLWAHTK
jgi:hypothetical protein